MFVESRSFSISKKYALILVFEQGVCVAAARHNLVQNQPHFA